jgi:CheY-like chemotaxis protein
VARMLLVEDYPDNLALLTYVLEAAGHEIVPAMTGAAALEGVRTAHPDLVVLDMQLPDMDGYEVLAAIRADPATAGLAVVAVTAYAMVGDRDEALEAGFDGYLSKPIDPSTFAASVAAYLPAAVRE